MRFPLLLLVVSLTILSLVVILVDALPIVRARLRRRRQVRAGSYGVVVDSRGRVLGTYLDPFLHYDHGARVHQGDSPWTTHGPDEWAGTGWAWEGFGPTQEEAHAEAERLRRRYLQLLPWLAEADEDEEWKG